MESRLGTGNFFGGILSDYRLRSFSSDFFVSWKVKSAAIFMFCATATSTIALGDVAFRETDGRIGITEYLMLQGVAGTLHALFSACPLPILRPTGPITAFVVDLFGVAERVQVDYYQLLSWVGLWVGLFLMVIAAFDLSRYIVLCTRFLHDIYAVFVCTIYISDGLIGVIERFQQVSSHSSSKYCLSHLLVRLFGSKRSSPHTWPCSALFSRCYSTTLTDL